MLINFMLVFALVMLILILLILIKSELRDDDYLGVYECGFDSMNQTRLWFSYRFFLMGVLFIVFDVEISLMMMLPYMNLSTMFVMLLFVFIFILLVGTVYEVEVGSMEWM